MSAELRAQKEKYWLECHFHDDEKTSIKKPDELGITPQDFAPLLRHNSGVTDRIKGSMFGLALGDALGAHVEFRSNSFLIANPVTGLVGGGTWGLNAGQFTDDTSMALCLANSLIACQDFVPYDQLVRYKWWYRQGYLSSTGHCFDIGAATRQSIEKFESRQKKFATEHGIPLDQVDSISDRNLLEAFEVLCSREGVAGNGALMRLGPVPLFFFRQPDLAIEYSGISGEITHGDQKAIDACRYYGALIVAALQGVDKSVLTSENFYDDHRDWFGGHALHDEIMAIAKGSYKKPGGYADGIRGKGYIVSALEAALWAFWSDDASFEIGALKAVNLGDDTDTTAAIYGQLAGAHYGYNKLPPRWLDSVYAKDFMLCVSSWIAFEGMKWYEKQLPPKITQLINTSDNKSSISLSNIRISLQPAVHQSYHSTSRSTTIIVNPIVRKVIEDYGRIGFLYDARKDCVLETSGVHWNTNPNKSSPAIQCMIKSGEKVENRNILRLVDFQTDLRLSVLSNLVTPKGIASVITYPYLIDEFTRIFYYSWLVRHQAFFDEKTITQKISTTAGTHIITAIDIGIEVVVLLKLPVEDSKDIDADLDKICTCLLEGVKITEHENVLNRILSTRIYSNIASLAQNTTLLNMCHELSNIRDMPLYHRPCNYILHPLNMNCMDFNQNNINFIPIEPKIATKIEDYWLRLSSVEKIWKMFLKEHTSSLCQVDLKDHFNILQNQVSKLIKEFNEEIRQGQEMIMQMRQTKESRATIGSDWKIDEKEKELKKKIEDLNHDLRALKEKQEFIEQIKDRGFAYRRAEDFDVKHGNTDEEIQNKIIKNISEQRILCSNDILNISQWSMLEDICKQMTDERQNNPTLNLIYVDFSYCSLELDIMKIFPHKTYSSTTVASKLLIPNRAESNLFQADSYQNQMINVLLIGKTGAGKSTLINMIGNCLKHKTYPEVQTNNFAVTVFVSSIFEIVSEVGRHLITIGKSDPNENDRHTEQSKTQRCKVHTFDIGNGQKLRLIDTPGFSNIHNNQAQDQITMQHVLSFVTNLTHLSAVCFVIDNNELEFNGYRQCLKQLIHFLGPEAQEYFIFCLTKCLTSNINKSEIISSVESILKSESLSRISSTDEKVLAFDSTFFINIAKARWINNEDPNRKTSWLMSKDASEKLIRFACQSNHQYVLYQGLQSVEYAKFAINQMARPIMEAMRHILRNNVIHKLKGSYHYIEIRPKPIQVPSAVCYSCPAIIPRYEGLWVAIYPLHEYRHSCECCSCDSKHHEKVDYQLDYVLVVNVNYSSNDFTILNHQIFSAIVHFSVFLNPNLDRQNDNPFLICLNRMIREENYICDHQSYYQMNIVLHRKLLKLQSDYNESLKRISQQNGPVDLITINTIIESIRRIPIIRNQINASSGIQENEF